MMSVDWTAVLVGLGVGTLTSAAFFAGLALGMRFALARPNAGGVLVLSAAARIAALLGIVWVVADQGGPWALAGFGVAFLVVRIAATSLAQFGPPVPVKAGDAP